MLKNRLLVFFCFCVLSLIQLNASEKNKMSVYDFKVKDINGKEVSLDMYKGKVILIVNVASQCGLTPQYKGLQELYKKYNKSGFEILAFPCNQFGSQEPGTNEEIKSFCSVNYQTTFPMFDKIEVNGKGTVPLYAYLKKQGKGFLGDEIKWNFTKFLIAKDGSVIDRFAPQTAPENLEKDILSALK